MAEKKKTLYRLPKQGKIFGVCAGLADFFDMDVTFVRIIFVVMAFATGGAVVLLYILLAIVLPVPGEDDASINKKVERVGKDFQESKAIYWSRNYVGISLVILGTWMFLGQLFPGLFDFRWDFVWPIILVIVGLIIIVRRSDGR